MILRIATGPLKTMGRKSNDLEAASSCTYNKLD